MFGSTGGATRPGSAMTSGRAIGIARLQRRRAAARYRAVKRAFDLALCVLLLPVIGLTALVLLLLNPWFNRGPLFFQQERMGWDCRPFRAWKFRTMTEAAGIERGAFDALESNRITPLGGLLRRTRVDELPQILNVLRGDMSLIGPRPDYYEHALTYLETIPGYRNRHAVLPGISGYAQTEVGYVDDEGAMHAKVAADLYYVRHASIRLDLWITWRTLVVVFGVRGA
jgi:lipopolysaccharide/colanic/teichoic acid biosynthesis glycosyltransferase